MTYTVLSYSTPASPRKDVKFSPTWRLAWVDVSLEKANRLVANRYPLNNNYKVVPSNEVNKYL